MRQVAGTLRLDLAQYRELAAFAQFGSDLDKSTQQQLNRGARLVEILKQGQYSPLPVAQQVVIIYAGTNGHLDAVPTGDVGTYQTALATFMETKRPGILQRIAEKKTLDDTLKAEINDALTDFAILIRRLRPLYTLFVNKWYFDELIELLIVRPALAIGRFANRVFERFVVDGLVSGTEETVRGAGGVVRAVQNGFVRSYALLLIAGFAGLALYFLLAS